MVVDATDPCDTLSSRVPVYCQTAIGPTDSTAGRAQQILSSERMGTTLGENPNELLNFRKGIEPIPNSGGRYTDKRITTATGSTTSTASRAQHILSSEHMGAAFGEIPNKPFDCQNGIGPVLDSGVRSTDKGGTTASMPPNPSERQTNLHKLLLSILFVF